jgi:hypothetical protein
LLKVALNTTKQTSKHSMKWHYLYSIPWRLKDWASSFSKPWFQQNVLWNWHHQKNVFIHKVFVMFGGQLVFLWVPGVLFFSSPLFIWSRPYAGTFKEKRKRTSSVF